MNSGRPIVFFGQLLGIVSGLLPGACQRAIPPVPAPVELKADAGWPQFRGPTGQGISEATRLPLEWSETKNVVWKTDLPGEGWSSPVIAGDQIWMTTAIEDGKSLRALCVDARDGKLLHDIEVFRVENPPPKHAANSYASPTPIIDGARLYVHFGTSGTACLSATDGKKLWENRELRINHENGPGGSFALYQDKLIIPCDGSDVQYEVALDTATGRIAWKTPRSAVFTKPQDMRKAYATPLLIEIDGQPQSVTAAADRLYAHDPESGKELWHVAYTGFSNVARPITGHGMLFICTGFRQTELWAIRLGGNRGDCTATHVQWKRTVSVPFQSSPVLIGDRIYSVTDGGIACCVDALTGREVWKERIGGEYAASPLAAAGRLYFFNSKGTCKVLAAGDTYQELAKNQLAAGFMASPAIHGQSLILRTKNSLYRIEDPTSQ